MHDKYRQYTARSAEIFGLKLGGWSYPASTDIVIKEVKIGVYVDRFHVLA
jgi:hypothetical protein